MPEKPRPRAGMTREVPGWLWLRGEGQQIVEWNALSNDFWAYIDLNVWEIATLRRWKTVDEQRGCVILNMEADVLGTVTPGSLQFTYVDP